ncbi:predicted protein [Chaetoceros tenuissimus]|uniref:Uncharacterized protein n=1 Tax=Chaetoceros tenuissimus TaxID=426638 RepID=A0AAD3CNY7_9STRA|nr:predicted protein [Chaetoceros tenuissimus]
MQQNALYALCVEASRYRFQRIQEYWNCARDVFLGFDRENQFNFDGCSAPCGLPTDFLHDERARNAFREIAPILKGEALLEFHRKCDKSLTPREINKYAQNIFNSYPTKIDMIVGATIKLPRRIRQDELLSADVSKALYAIRSSERAKAVRTFDR